MSLLKCNHLKKLHLQVFLRRNNASDVTKTAVIPRGSLGQAINPQTTPFVNPVSPTTTRVIPPLSTEIHKPINVSSFDDVPGPVSLNFLSKIWNVIPVIGTEITSRMIQYMLSAGKLFGSQLSWGSTWWQHLFGKFFTVYGPVVRLRGPFGGDVVLISRPEHAKILFNSEVAYPVRASLDSVEKYCMNHRKYKQPGLFLMSGLEWDKLRKTIEAPLKSIAFNQITTLDKISDEFITRIIQIRNAQEEMPSSFKDEIYKWTLECLCSVTLNKRLGFLDPSGLSTSSDPLRLLESLKGATEAVQKCEIGFHMWKFVETPSWKSLVRNCDNIDTVMHKYVQQAHDSLRAQKDGAKVEKTSLIECLLLRENMYPEDVMTVLLDLMLVGVNATVHTVAFMFYHLAKSPRCQQKLYEEICEKKTLTKDDVKNMPYMQACIKEVLRLKPAIPFLTRITNNDMVVHNYSIPKGTHVMVATRISSVRDEHFEDSHKFMPERWLHPELGLINKDLKDFAFMPYGFGARGCIAKELAEMQITILLSKVLKKFRIEYFYADILSTQRLFSMPDKPLKFRFVERI
ncbi:unnamed protein product [Brassicogethes aeneus]|uniref:Cytochrome P450 n=1 Tax=Brassicogethes aeneus TaxID=1431903 RepID=A0A9P0BFA4_BRAAE|nr:unnamed protein product [Brassicogethes aeneus]